jgi:hypothetical protein
MAVPAPWSPTWRQVVTALDLARCELEAKSLWGTSLTVVSSDAPRADRIVAGPLRSVDTA